VHKDAVKELIGKCWKLINRKKRCTNKCLKRLFIHLFLDKPRLIITFETKLKQNQMKKLKGFLVLLLSLIMLSGMSQQQGTSKITSNGVQGSAQRGLTAFESCPPVSVFSQAPTLPDGAWSAYTSDDNPLFTYEVYENFSGITQPITAVHFWGLKLYWAGGWDVCTGENSVVFNVKFYQDNAGSPGALVESESINIYEDNTGLDFGGNGYLYHYLAVLEFPVNLSAGWVSIQGTVSLNPDDCVFLWMNSPTGDGSGLQSPVGPVYDNLSLCIEAGGGPVPETPVSPWALAIGIFLIAGSIMLRYRRLI
jgi:hypothetical protein